MYRKEGVKKAISTFIRFDHSYADTIRALGHPDRQTLWLWWESYQKNDHKVIVCLKRRSKYSEDENEKPSTITLNMARTSRVRSGN